MQLEAKKLGTSNGHLEADLELNKKLLKKYEDLSESLQSKVLAMTLKKDKAEVLANKKHEEAEVAKREKEDLIRFFADTSLSHWTPEPQLADCDLFDSILFTSRRLKYLLYALSNVLFSNIFFSIKIQQLG